MLNAYTTSKRPLWYPFPESLNAQIVLMNTKSTLSTCHIDFSINFCTPSPTIIFAEKGRRGRKGPEKNLFLICRTNWAAKSPIANMTAEWMPIKRQADCSHLRRILQINPLFANAALSATRDVRERSLPASERRPKIEVAAPAWEREIFYTSSSAGHRLERSDNPRRALALEYAECFQTCGPSCWKTNIRANFSASANLRLFVLNPLAKHPSEGARAYI